MQRRLVFDFGSTKTSQLTARPPLPEVHIEADLPGHRVQMDCFFIGRLSGTKGVVWQYTAIDVASSYTWAELRVTPKNPSAQWTSVLTRRVAAELASKGWRLEAVMTDNASEFRSQRFNHELAQRQTKHISRVRGRSRLRITSSHCSR
jgi:hypothetical protein